MAYYKYNYYHGYYDCVTGGVQRRSFDSLAGHSSVVNYDVAAEEKEIFENETVPMDESFSSSSISSSLSISGEKIESEQESLCNKDMEEKTVVEDGGTVPKEDDDEFWARLWFGASDSDPTWETALLGPIPWTPMPAVLVPEEAEEEKYNDKSMFTADPTYRDDEMSAPESFVRTILPMMDYDY
jgi:hypothetical protein